MESRSVRRGNLDEDGIPKPNLFKHSSSFTTQHQLVQFNFAYIISSLAWWTFFTPLASKYQIENAFGLPYIGVHIVGLYIGLGAFFVAAYPTYWIFWSSAETARDKHYRAEAAMMTVASLCLLGSIVKLFSYMNAAGGGYFWCYAAGHTLNSLGLAIAFVIQTLVNKHLYKDVYALLDSVGAMALGLAAAHVLTATIYISEDKFFTKFDHAAFKNFWIMVTQSILFFICFLYKWIKAKVSRDDQRGRENLIQEDVNPNADKLQKRQRLRCIAIFFQSLPFPILLTVFFYLYQKLPQYASLFWFTQNQQDVIAAFFACGSLLGAQSFNFLVVAFFSWYRLFQFFLIGGFITCVVLINYKNSELYQMCLFASFIGLTLTCLISQEIYRLDRVKQNGTIPLAFTWFGLFASALTWFGDRTHYMNRDDPLWSYISMGIAGGLVLFAWFFSINWIFNGCRCCSCCCRCCVDCCGTISEDDDEDSQ